jgi:hypothetical protein
MHIGFHLDWRSGTTNAEKHEAIVAPNSVIYFCDLECVGKCAKGSPGAFMLCTVSVCCS